MTLNALFRVDGVPCLISDFVVTGQGSVEITIPTYPDVEKVLPKGRFRITHLIRKAALIGPGFVVIQHDE